MATLETSPAPSPSPSCFTPRTTSPSFAKQDCITCAALREECDRARPHCTVCASHSRQCGGFAVDLVWKDAITPKRTKTKTNAVRKAPAESSCIDSARRQSKPQDLKFVKAQVGSKKRRKTKTAYSAGLEAGIFSKFTLEMDMQNGGIEAGTKTPESSASQSTPHGDVASPDDTQTSATEAWQSTAWPAMNAALPLYGGFVFPPEQLPSGFFDDCHQGSHGTNVFELPTGEGEGGELSMSPSAAYDMFVTADDEGSPDDNMLELFSQVPNGVTFQSLAHKYQDILESYNTNYCVVPLRTDCPNNPFRVSRSLIERYPFLLHGVLAISSRHQAKRDKSVTLEDQAHNHWSTSLQLLSTANYSSSDFLPLLDTVLVLANFESMQSAYNMVNMHLDGARKMLQEAGLSTWSHYSPRLRAQLAMLVWWDVTVSLIARRKPRLPSTYMDTLVNYDGDESDGWSSFTLNGCPMPFIAAMSRLASLAAVYEQTKKMEYTIFDHSAVEEIVKQVEEFTDVDGPRQVDDGADTLRNRHHCIEAWRHAILLYAERVFKPAPDKEGLHRITHLSRLIFDSVRCIPPTETLQKQVLLPVFLAAAEVGNEWNREFAREYCSHWNRVSNFDQFETVGRLLEEIWAGWSEDTRGMYWWGVKVPAAAAAIGGGNVPMAKMLQLG